MTTASPLVLTYHSISSGIGPTSIPVETFEMQMSALSKAGYASMMLKDFLDWRAGGPDGRRVLITFDDAFLDFKTAAFPILRRHGFTALVFAPTGRLGGPESWVGADNPPRPLMSWEDLMGLAAEGVEFGGHSVSHADLTAIDPESRRREIGAPAADLALRLGRETRSFAAPYGHVNATVLSELEAHYDIAFGTRFDRPRRDDPLFDVPRIEMHYFRDPKHWRDFLEGRSAYFNLRKGLRAAREGAARFRRPAAADERPKHVLEGPGHGD